MTKNLLEFPQQRTRQYRQTQIDTTLATDPNYRFIRDLLLAIEDVGLELDKPAEAKARELYTKCLQENRFAQYAREVSIEQES
jgi:hypothetical protein